MATLRESTPAQGLPGVSQHMMTWDNYQDGRIRVALALAIFGIVVGVMSLILSARRFPTETVQHSMVCPAVTVPACPSLPVIPACPVIPQCPPIPVCPGSRGLRR